MIKRENNILAFSLVVGAQPVDTSPKQVTRHTHTGNIGRSTTFYLVYLCLDVELELHLGTCDTVHVDKNICPWELLSTPVKVKCNLKSHVTTYL